MLKRDWLYIGIIFMFCGVIVFLSIRTTRQTDAINSNKAEIKSMGKIIDSLAREDSRKMDLLNKGLEVEKKLAETIAKTDSFNLALKKKIKQYAKPDFSHVTDGDARFLLSDRAARYRSYK